MNKFSIKGLIIIAATITLLSGHAMAAVKISSIPPPPSTAKLRIFTMAVTSSYPKSGFYPLSDQEFSANMIKRTVAVLNAQGIYEVVSARELQTVVGTQSIAAWDWMAQNCALAKEVGKALHADYVLIIERSQKIHFQHDMTLINLSTGKQYNVSDYSTLSGKTVDQFRTVNKEMVQSNYRKLFMDAKGDLLRTAILKGKLGGNVSIPEKTVAPVNQLSQTPQEPKAIAALSQQEPPRTVPLAQSVKSVETDPQRAKSVIPNGNKSDSPRLVVYDFEAADRMKIVGLILTEALREELHNLGGFVLVNRENILKIMDEYKLQQSSLVNEKQAVKVGQWLAASEAVTGNLAILGNTSILQVKRIDIKTMGTISLGSLKCPAGKEDELLNHMSELARKLVHSK